MAPDKLLRDALRFFRKNLERIQGWRRIHLRLLVIFAWLMNDAATLHAHAPQLFTTELVTLLPAAAQVSGVQLEGRTSADRAPDAWWLADAVTGKTIVTVRGKWGIAEAPAGEYVLWLRPQGHNAADVAWSNIKVEPDKTTTVKIDSGVQVTGRSEQETKLDYWWLTNAADNKVVANVYQQWGFTPLPPGEYKLWVRPQGHNAADLLWTNVTVEAGKTVSVNIDSGVEAAGRTEQDLAMYYWWLIPAGGGKTLANVYQRWGFTPLPPGEYDLWILPQGHNAANMRWTTITVEPNKTTAVKIESGLEVAGRNEQDLAMYYWWLTPAGGGKTLANVHQRWGFTPLPPGEYDFWILPQGHNAADIMWTTVTIGPGKTASVKLDSGIEVTSRNPNDQPLDYWWTRPAGGGKTLAHVYQRWGYSPMPPGEYELWIRPQGHNAADLLWTNVSIEPGKTTAVKLDSGIEVTGRDASDKPLEYWWTTPAGGGKTLAHVHQRWGYTPLAPGTYDLWVLPQGHNATDFVWTTSTIEPGKTVTAKIDSGIELVPDNESDTPFEYWYVTQVEADKGIASVYNRWGYTPVPPGTYRVSKAGAARGIGKEVTIAPQEVVRVMASELEQAEAATTGLLVTAKAGDTIVELSWPAPIGLQVQGYRVYRAGSSRPIHGQRILKSTQFTDIGLTNGRRYKYHVTAVAEDNRDWEGYRDVECIPQRQ